MDERNLVAVSIKHTIFWLEIWDAVLAVGTSDRER